MIYLAKHGWETVGVDYSPKAIRTAKRKVEHGYNAQFHIDDVTRLHKITGSFDFVLDMGCFHSLNKIEQDSYIKNVDRLLKLGGYYLLYVIFRSTTKN